MTKKEQADVVVDQIVAEVRKHKQRTAIKLHKVHYALEHDQFDTLPWDNEPSE